MKIVTLRLPEKLLEELDELTEAMKDHPIVDADNFKRTDLIRVCLRRGLEVVRAEVIASKKRKKR